jgi:hypothetical protein
MKRINWRRTPEEIGKNKHALTFIELFDAE